MTTDDHRDTAVVSGIEGTVPDDFDWAQTRPSTAVVEVVSRALDVEATATEPLYNVIDPDALDRLVAADGSDRAGSPVSIGFTYEGLDVMVASDGTVTVADDPVSP